MKGELEMKITVSCSLVLLASAVFAGQPLVSVDKVERKGKWLVVNYTLSGDRGIVTPSLLTNGVPVVESMMTTFEGDICKLVEPGARQFRWNACADWPKQTLPDATVRLTAWSELNPPNYMVVDLETEKTVNYYVSTNALPAGGLANDIYRTVKLVMRKIPVTAEGKLVHDMKSYNAHRTLFTRDFYMAIYPATQKQYSLMAREFANESDRWPSHFTNAADRAMRPVETVAWPRLREMSAVGFKYDYKVGDRMSHDNIPADDKCVIAQVRRFTGLMVDIPTVDEWEYACRAGTTGDYYYDNPGTGANFRLGRVKENGGWKDLSLDPNQGDEKAASRNWPATWGTAKVGSYPPNPWGLYDMIGNVWEWTVGFKHEYTDASNVNVDPVGGEVSNEDEIQVNVIGGRWYAAPQSITTLHGSSATSLDGGSMYKGGVRLVAPVGNFW